MDRGTDALDRAKQPREGMNEPEGRASLLCTQRGIIIRIPSGARGYTHCQEKSWFGPGHERGPSRPGQRGKHGLRGYCIGGYMIIPKKCPSKKQITLLSLCPAILSSSTPAADVYHLRQCLRAHETCMWLQLSGGFHQCHIPIKICVTPTRHQLRRRGRHGALHVCHTRYETPRPYPLMLTLFPHEPASTWYICRTRSVGNCSGACWREDCLDRTARVAACAR